MCFIIGVGDKCQHGCIFERFNRRADISDIGMEENGTEVSVWCNTCLLKSIPIPPNVTELL